MRNSNWTLLAVIPILMAIFCLACNTKSGEADPQVDTLMDSDTVVAEEMLPVDTTDTIYHRCDTLPQFEGGMQEFVNATLSHLQFPQISSQYQCSGTYHFDLIIEKNGKIYNAHLMKKEHVKIIVPDSVDYQTAMAQVDAANLEAVAAAVKQGPACTPAMVNGAPVRFALRVPINMVLEQNPDAK